MESFGRKPSPVQWGGSLGVGCISLGPEGQVET